MSKIDELLGRVADKRAEGLDAARPRMVEKAHAAGRPTARERLALLVDPGTFLEWGALAEPTHDTDENKDLYGPGDAVVTGTAEVDGRPVSIVNLDATILGGSMSVTGGSKTDRALEWSLNHGQPYVLFAEGGGHRIQDGLNSKHFAHGGGTRAMGTQFALHGALSGWVPTAAAVTGVGFAGPTNFAMLCDFTVMVRGGSTIGMTGPALVKAGIGEIVDAEDLGGAGMQADRNGAADLAVDSVQEAVEAIRLYLSYFPSNASLTPPVAPNDDPVDRLTPELRDLVPVDLAAPYDMLQVIDAVADLGSVFELKPTHAGNLITALGRVGGRPVGFIANQPAVRGGVLDSAAADKGARFISLCDAFGIALVYLVDIPGFLIGTEAEESNLVKHAVRLLYELGQATVPRFSVVLRKGYGLGYYAMAGGRSFKADLAVSWPQAELAAMSIDGAVDVAYRRRYVDAEDPVKARQDLIDNFRTRTGALRGAEGFGIDDVIDPADTRRLLARALTRSGWRRPPLHPNPGRLHPVQPV
jgi:acetyl-CoA carboxylase carboxyltransferase component